MGLYNLTRSEEDVVCPNLQKLIVTERLDEEETRNLNRVDSDKDYRRFLSRVTRKYGLNASQEQAVESTVTKRLSLIHGPPGTGKTKTCVAVVVLQQELHGHLYACAPSNLAADTLAVGIKNADVTVRRYGHLDSITAEYEDALYSVSLDRMVQDEIWQSVGGDAWKRERKNLFNRELLEQECVFTGTVDSSVSGPVLATQIVPFALIDEAAQTSEFSVFPLLSMTQNVCLAGQQTYCTHSREGVGVNPLRDSSGIWEDTSSHIFFSLTMLVPWQESVSLCSLRGCAYAGNIRRRSLPKARYRRWPLRVRYLRALVPST
jgi:hypothetical protein